MFMNIIALRVLEGTGLGIEKRSAARRHAVDVAEGFEGFELLRPRSSEDRYFIITRQDTRKHYDAQVAGHDTNTHADDERRGMPIGLLGFEVVQHDGQSERIATATQVTAMAQICVASLQVMPSGSQSLTVMVVIPGEIPVRVSNALAGA